MCKTSKGIDLQICKTLASLHTYTSRSEFHFQFCELDKPHRNGSTEIYKHLTAATWRS